MEEITVKEQNKVKRRKRTEDTLRDIWDNIKCINIPTIGVPEEEERKKQYGENFEGTRVEIFPNEEKEIVKQVQEAQRAPYQTNLRRNISRHILMKLAVVKHRDRISKAIREKQHTTCKGNPIS